MNWLTSYDAWCYRRIEDLLTWLNEWFSISQKHAEQGMIVLYMSLNMVPKKLELRIIIIQITCSFCVGNFMWLLHRRPAAMRSGKYSDRRTVISRTTLQGVFISLIVFLLVVKPSSWFAAAAQIVYIVFYYATDIVDQGKRGRRRKLALAELKKMFGVEWIPKPIAIPQ